MAEKKGPRLIWGARAIGEFIGVDKAKAFYLLQKGRIPARKVGGEWVAEEGKLTAFFIGDAAATEAASTEAA